MINNANWVSIVTDGVYYHLLWSSATANSNRVVNCRPRCLCHRARCLLDLGREFLGAAESECARVAGPKTTSDDRVLKADDHRVKRYVCKEEDEEIGSLDRLRERSTER